MSVLKAILEELILYCVNFVVGISDSAVQMMGPVPDEQRLYTDLMELYEPAVRPVLNASKTIIVNFQISLNQIVDLVGITFNFY